MEDDQIVRRVWINVRYPQGAVAVSGPETPVGRDKHTVRSGRVVSRRTVLGSHHSNHPPNTGLVETGLHVDDVHAIVRPIGQVVSLRARIDPCDIGTDDGVAGNWHNADELERAAEVVIVMIAVIPTHLVVTIAVFGTCMEPECQRDPQAQHQKTGH
jgi:hypothetical protein